MKPHWRQRPGAEERGEELAGLARRLALPAGMEILLHQRGLAVEDDIRAFLAPQLSALPDPWTMRDMEQAVFVTEQAIQARRPVLICGDYDADGVCATALITEFLQSCGLRVLTCIPDRIEDGYGLSLRLILRGFRELAEKPLIITVDNGTAAVDEIKELTSFGLEVIVTDHHQINGQRPDCAALLNPCQPDCGWQHYGLSGSGVAFVFCMALRSRLARKGFWKKSKIPNLKRLLDLVALGTVADVMELTAVNRILVRAGQEELSDRQRPGLRTLCALAGLPEGWITAEDIGFRLAPRLNAAGRLGSAELALQLLQCRNQAQATELAWKLEALNTRRKELCEQALAEARLIVEKQPSDQRMVILGPDWAPGILGILAGRLSEEYGHPMIVLAKDPRNSGMLQGSGRSGGTGLDLHGLVADCSHYLERFGGHRGAVGLSLKAEQLASFSQAFCRCVDQALERSARETIEWYDIELDTSREQLTDELIEALPRMEPFGPGNPEPVFLVRNCEPLHVRTVGRDHLRFSFPLGSREYEAIGFSMANQVSQDRGIDFLCHFRHSIYQGRRRVQAVLKDIDTTG